MVGVTKRGRKPDKSLWRELADGTAGVVVRLAVSLAVGLSLLAMAMIVSWPLSVLLEPSPRYGIGSGRLWTFRATDEAIGVALILAGVVYVGALYWIWSRHRNSRPIWLAAAMTVGTWVAVLAACVGIDELFRGDEEALYTAVCSVAGAVTLLIWLQIWRRYAGGRVLYGQDGQIDLRCPQCEYRMVGLSQARCPECGQQYTIDELVAKQDFEALRSISAPASASSNPQQPSLASGGPDRQAPLGRQ